MPNPKKIKLKSWAHLVEVSKPIKYEDSTEYFVPMGAHGLPTTKVVLDADDQVKQELKYHDDNKWSKTGTILLIGSGS